MPKKKKKAGEMDWRDQISNSTPRHRAQALKALQKAKELQASKNGQWVPTLKGYRFVESVDRGKEYLS